MKLGLSETTIQKIMAELEDVEAVCSKEIGIAIIPLDKYEELTSKPLEDNSEQRDWKDDKIIECLKENARMSMSEISRRTGIPISVVYSRMNTKLLYTASKTHYIPYDERDTYGKTN